MFCPDCGASVAEGRKFCGKCGGQLHVAGGSVEVAPTAPANVFQPAAPVPATPISPRRKMLYYAIAALLAVLAGGAWWWFHRPAPAYQVQDPGVYPFQGLSADGKTTKWGFVDADGKVLVQPAWDGVDIGSLVLGRPAPCNEGMCGVLKDGKWGYIDTTGHQVISNQFESVAPFVEGLARIHLGNQIGFIDKTGQYAINPQFYEAGDFHGGLAAVRADGGWGFINKTGTFVIKPHFQVADTNGFAGGLAGVCFGGKCGYIDRSGQFVVKPQFGNIGTFSEGLAEVQIENKFGFINSSGNIVINPQFDQTTMFSGQLAAVSISGHQGTINKLGKFVVNPGQYTLELREGDVLVASTSDGIGLLSRDGKWASPPSKALTGVGPIFGKVFLGFVSGQLVPISMSGKVLAGPYKSAMLQSLAQDIENDNNALMSVRMLIAAEASYSGTYAAKGFTASIPALGPATAAPDDNHAGLIAADLATGTKDNYQFSISIPEGTSTGGTNFNYFLMAKPAAGHVGRSFCADSSGAVHYSVPGEECTLTSPTL